MKNQFRSGILLLAVSTFTPCAANADVMTPEQVYEKILLLESQIEDLKKALPLQADSAAESGKPQFDLTARATFTKPVVDGFSTYGFSANGGNEDKGSYETLNFDNWSTGYEINAKYQFKDSGLGLEFGYTSLAATTSNSFSIGNGDRGGRVPSIDGDERDDLCLSPKKCEVGAEMRIGAYTWNFGGDYSLALNKNIDLNIGAGLQSSSLSATLNSYDNDYDALIGAGKETSSAASLFSGYGPYIKTGFRSTLFKGFSIGATGKAGLLFGSKDASVTDHDSANYGRLEVSRSSTAAVPNYGLDFTAAYAIDLSKDVSLILDGGYEINTFSNALDTSLQQAEWDDGGNSYGTSTDLILQGWKAGLGIKYVF